MEAGGLDGGVWGLRIIKAIIHVFIKAHIPPETVFILRKNTGKNCTNKMKSTCPTQMLSNATILYHSFWGLRGGNRVAGGWGIWTEGLGFEELRLLILFMYPLRIDNSR